MKSVGLVCIGLSLLGMGLTGCPQGGTPPAASFKVSPARGQAPAQISFSDASTDGGAAIASWAWDFGDGGVNTQQNPAHTYTRAGTYSVSLTVTTSAGSNTSVVTECVAVDKGTPSVAAWPEASGIVFGQALAESVLTAGAASVPGAYEYVAP